MSDTLSRNDPPSLAELEAELARVKRKRRGRRAFAAFVGVLAVVAAVAVLVSTLLMPVLSIRGDSMEPTLNSGDVAVALSVGDIEAGDVVAFKQDNQVLVKRVVALAGDTVDVTDEGVVVVNGVALDEPYVSELSLGSCNVDLPCKVEDGCLFVMGDNRVSSVDSRNLAVGCVAEDQLIGKLVLRVWPIEDAGLLR